MKYVILIPDGCADLPLPSHGGKTPMQLAKTPNMDRLARTGILGRSKNVPARLSPGSDVATISLLGYDPLTSFSGRAPLEAAAQGIEIAENQWAFRCNLVCVCEENMKSFTAGHVSTQEATELLKSLEKTLAPTLENPICFYPSVGYRNLMIFSEKEKNEPVFTSETKTFAPHDYTDKPIAPALPQGPGRELLNRLMLQSRDVFTDHPVNRRRINEGKLPATQCWLWGQGKKPNIESFERKFQKVLKNVPFRGAMITAVDLLRGIAKLLRWDVIDVPGITGYVDTDYAAKGMYAAKALQQYDLLCVHIEAPDESGHEGAIEKKIRSLEEIDSKTLPPILETLQNGGDWRIFISPDHPTPISLKTHTHGEVPWIIAGSGISSNLPETGNIGFDEPSAARSPIFFDPGSMLMENFLEFPFSQNNELF